MSDVYPLSGILGVSFDFTLLSPLLLLCQVLLLFLSCLFFPLWPFLLTLFQENSAIFFAKKYDFLYGFCLATGRS